VVADRDFQAVWVVLVGPAHQVRELVAHTPVQRGLLLLVLRGGYRTDADALGSRNRVSSRDR
jgi:hypothetical protein